MGVRRMKYRNEKAQHSFILGGLGLFAFSALITLVAVGVLPVSTNAQDDSRRLILVYDRGQTIAFLTEAKTVEAALKDQGINLDARDTVEPSRDEELVASDYRVNIYRARPVVVQDGAKRVKVMTPYQTVEHIAEDANIKLHPEDLAVLQRSTDIVGDGAGLELTIKRSVPIVLDLYGNKRKVRTQGATVAEMLTEKNITLGKNGRVSLDESTRIKPGLEVRVWREGKQTITIDETIPFDTERIFDADREVGYKQVKTAGQAGMRAITYEVEIKDGVELSRNEIARLVTKTPKKQVVIYGVKANPNSLTESKGAQHFTDSKGVVHRETYYDLDMGVVMQACGQGGEYDVRVDGVKIDSDGYVIIAAHLGLYPRCSVVETSLGPGKVYDTGGFVQRHPHGFDIATDWTNNNGR